MKRHIVQTFVYGSFILLGWVALACQKSGPSEFVTVSPQDFQKHIQEKSGLLLDVRTPAEYGEGYIAGATNIDFYSDDFKDRIAALDKDQPIFVYCRSGGRSGKTMAQMQELGFKWVYNLDGGALGWSKQGLPLEKPESP